MTKLVFLDTETTGLDPRPREVGGKGYEIWEIAYAIVDTENDTDDLPRSFDNPEWKHWFFSVDLRNADLIALNIGGFFERYPETLLENPNIDFIANGQTRSRYYLSFDALWKPAEDTSNSALSQPTSPWQATKSLAGTVYEIMRDLTGAHIVGAIPDFDTRFLTELLYRWGGVPSWHYHIVDIEALVVGYLTGMSHSYDVQHGVGSEYPPSRWQPPWKSDALWSAMDIDRTEPQYAKHTARGDAQLVLDCYRKVMGV